MYIRIKWKAPLSELYVQTKLCVDGKILAKSSPSFKPHLRLSNNPLKVEMLCFANDGNEYKPVIEGVIMPARELSE